MSEISDSGDSIVLYTTKGTIPIHVEYIDEKSFDVLYKATKNKSCVKITTQGDFPSQMTAVKVTCPKKLPAIKN